MHNSLVTGGAGFIGSHLCRRLINEGHRVICLDNFYTGKRTNVRDLLSSDRFSIVRYDITRPEKVPISGIKIDRIYNLACPAAPPHYQYNPVKTIKTNVIGVSNMLGFAHHHGARILQASTSEVYGDPLVHPQKEDYWGNVNPIGIRSCYDEGKRCAETLCMDYHRQHGVDIRIIRIFNTYGPYMLPNDGRVVSNFIVAALKNKPLTIYGDGSHTRSFQYVDDLVEAMIKMMENNKKFIGPVNVGNPGEFTVKELAQKVLQLISQSKSKIEYKPLPEDDPKRRKPDITLAKKMLGWEPTVALEDGLIKTIDYFATLK